MVAYRTVTALDEVQILCPVPMYMWRNWLRTGLQIREMQVQVLSCTPKN